MNCSIQWLCEHTFILRTHPDGDFGDPYTFSITCKINNQQIILYGALRAPTPMEWRAIRQSLKEMGFDHAKWERKNKLARTIIKR